MKLKILALCLLAFPLSPHAETIDGLIKKHGKPVIMGIISKKIHNEFTISVNGALTKAFAPNEDYISAVTLSIDLNRAGMTIEDIEEGIRDRIISQKAEEKRKAEELRARQELDNKVRQETQRREDEENKFWAEASEEDRKAFKKAQEKGQKLEIIEKRHSTNSVPATIEHRDKSPQNPICAIDSNKLSEHIKEGYEKRYPGHYSTQKMLYDNDMDSYSYLCNLNIGMVEIEVLNKHLSRYYPHMSTIKMLFEADMDAYRELHK